MQHGQGWPVIIALLYKRIYGRGK